MEVTPHPGLPPACPAPTGGYWMPMGRCWVDGCKTPVDDDLLGLCREHRDELRSISPWP